MSDNSVVEETEDSIARELAAERERQRINYVTGLRAAADFYEQHPEIVVPSETAITNYRVDSKEEARLVIKAVGTCQKKYDEYNFTVVKEITPNFNLRFVFLRDTVCEKVIVGTKVVPEHVIPAEPAREEKFVPRREEPVYEYRCPSILADAQGGR